MKIKLISILLLLSILSCTLVSCVNEEWLQDLQQQIQDGRGHDGEDEEENDLDDDDDDDDDDKDSETSTDHIDHSAPTNFKLGVILLNDESSPYDRNFMQAITTAASDLGLKSNQIIYQKNVPETFACYDAAVDLAEQGCNVIFANSFGHESYLLLAAKDFPHVEFCHASGTMAHTEALDNYHNAYAAIYEGTYLAGVAAGLKLKEMMEQDHSVIPKIGYVGTYPYAEVISSYTAYYLGVKSIVPNVTMDVQFTGCWYDPVAEKIAAMALINGGCVILSQYSDSMGVPNLCEERNVPNVPHNTSTAAACPTTFLVSAQIDWTPYIKLICENTMNNRAIPTDYTGTLTTGSVLLTPLGVNAAEGTQEMLDAITIELLAGTRKVFHTFDFTVHNERLTEHWADVDTDIAFTPDTNVISDGYFHESEYRSAPYFDIQIDGITLLNFHY